MRRARSSLIVPFLVKGVLGLWLLFFAVAPAMGQSSNAFIFGIGYDFGVPLSLRRTPPVERWCATCNGDGTSYNHAVQITLERRFADVFTPRLGFDLLVSAGAESGRFTSDQYLSDLLVPDGTGGTVQPIIQREIDAKPYVMRLELQLDWDAGDGFRLRGGPWGSYRLSDEFIATEKIVSPGDVTFPTGAGIRSRVVASGDSLGSSLFSGGLVFGGSFDLRSDAPLHPRIELHSHVDADALGRGLGLRAFSVGGGMSLVWSGNVADRQGGEVVESPVLPEQPPTRPPRTSTLDAEIDLHGVGPGGEELPYAVLEPEQVRHIVRVPLLPTVFFDSGSVTIPKRYLASGPHDPATFSTDSLARRSPIEVYHNVLDILGMRMSRAHDARIVMMGYRSVDEPPDLPGSRMEAVSRYLETVWSLDPSQIEFHSESKLGAGIVEEGPAARRVSITSNRPGVLDPVTTTWIEERYRRPTINLKPSITSDVGVRSWSVTVRQGSRVIQSTSSDGTELADGASILVLDKNAPPEPLVAELTVEDSIGAVRIVRDTLPLQISRSNAVGDARVRSEYLFLPSTETPFPDPLLEQQLRTLAASVEYGAHVTIQVCDADHPHDDRLGDTVANDLHALLSDRGIRPEVVPHQPSIGDGERIPAESWIFDSAVTVIVERAATP